MDPSSRTIDVLVDRMEMTRCEHCNCEIDVSDLTLFDQIICPECNLQGVVPCKLGPYLMQDRIGSGAMGTVYRATDEFLARTVAIKVLKKKLGENKTSIEKFKREAMAIAQPIRICFPELPDNTSPAPREAPDL
jgi:serine/threonine protein kinase